MQRKDLAEVFRITDHILRLGLGQDVTEKATIVRRCAQMAKMHPFECSYFEQLDNSLQEFGMLLIEIGYLEPMVPWSQDEIHTFQ